MPRSKHKPVAIKLYCRQCFATFSGTLRGKSISCQRIRQHINKTARCFNAYSDEGLIVPGKGVVNLRSSIDDGTPSPDKQKRKASKDPPNMTAPKRVLIRDLSPAFLQEVFGAHAASNMLLKGETFSEKEKFIRTQNWKAPSNELLNNLFCNANIEFNHFTQNAILLNPKVEHLANPKPKSCLPPTEVVAKPPNDDCSIMSSVGSFGQQEGTENASSDGGEEENPDNEASEDENADADADDEAYSFASDENVDGGSIRSHLLENNEDNESNGSTQRMENLAEIDNENTGSILVGDAPAVEPNAAFGDHHHQAATPAIQNPITADGLDFSLLHRWNQQCLDNKVRHGISPDAFIVSELGLLRIQHTHGLSLEAVKAVKQWAHDSYVRYPRVFNKRPQTRKKQLDMIRAAMGIKGDTDFQEIAINWLPQNKKRAIHTRSFMDCIYELLSNEELVGHDGKNICLPHPQDPYKHRPDECPEFSSELHHGWWWSGTMDELCEGEKEILVPIIGYMDGVSTDNNSRLPVTPFNLTLGIFNTETRRKAEAWTTILLYPDDNSEASIQKGTKPIHKLQNLHNCISVAFRELKELMESKRRIVWRLKYGPDGEEWEVHLKFAFAYVIGDTEMHDKLCGRYGPRTKTVKSVCRHCNCKTDELIKGGDLFEGNCLYTPEMLDPDKFSAEYFKSISHHPWPFRVFPGQQSPFG